MLGLLGVKEAKNLKFFQARVYSDTNSKRLLLKLVDKTSAAARSDNLPKNLSNSTESVLKIISGERKMIRQIIRRI
jgi:hypothetical protein